MAKKSADKVIKLTLVKIGNSFVNPLDVSCIRAVKSQYNKQLYVIDLISNPSPKYTFWAKAYEIELLLKQFNIIVNDDPRNYSQEKDDENDYQDIDYPGNPRDFGDN